jgi:hypothetical protein
MHSARTARQRSSPRYALLHPKPYASRLLSTPQSACDCPVGRSLRIQFDWAPALTERRLSVYGSPRTVKRAA